MNSPPGQVADRQIRTRKNRRTRIGFPHVSLIPLSLVLLLLVAFPLVELIRMAFSNLTLAGGEFNWSFSGLENANAMLNDQIFWTSVYQTLILVSVAVLVEVILGTALAIIVEGLGRAASLARNLLIWPVIVTPVAVGVTFSLILNPEFGILNYILGVFNLPTQAWLSSTTWALPTVIAVDVWHWTPFVFLLVLAALAGVDRSLYEAARTDGASAWQLIWHVTLPGIAPTIATAALLRIVLGFKVFDEVYLLTSGGPGTSTEVISTYIHDVFSAQGNLGYGSFLSLTTIVILGSGIGLFFVIRAGVRKWVA